MTALVFLGGPPGVGKTSVAPHLAERLSPCAWLEADDLWRIVPWEVNDETRALVEGNVIHVLRSFLQARYDYVLLTWVLHREDLVERLLAPLSSLCQATSVIHLVSDESTLRTRIAREPGRRRSPDRALQRLSQIEALPYAKVDTSSLSPEQVADLLAATVSPR